MFKPDSKIKNTGIPNNTIIKPCDFDKIADQNNQWLDITDSVMNVLNEASMKMEC